MKKACWIAYLLLTTIGMAGPAKKAADSDPAFYQKKSTWQESFWASREDKQRRVQRAVDAQNAYLREHPRVLLISSHA